MKGFTRLLALVSAFIVAPYSQAQLTINHTQALGFGTFVANSGGMVTVGTNGVRSAAGGVLLLNAVGGSAASFNVSDSDPANSNRAYIITLPDNGTVTLTNGSNSMAVNNFVSSPSDSGVLSGGAQIVTVGSTLTVGASQPPGSYSGNFSLLVEYQ
jgi:hypothetical protein